jgi:hypothetical protein
VSEEAMNKMNLADGWALAELIGELIYAEMARKGSDASILHRTARPRRTHI